jgi:hypothetical protein
MLFAGITPINPIVMESFVDEAGATGKSLY